MHVCVYVYMTCTKLLADVVPGFEVCFAHSNALQKPEVNYAQVWFLLAGLSGIFTTSA